jgi:hypothetical protein
MKTISNPRCVERLSQSKLGFRVLIPHRRHHSRGNSRITIAMPPLSKGVHGLSSLYLAGFPEIGSARQ